MRPSRVAPIVLLAATVILATACGDQGTGPAGGTAADSITVLPRALTTTERQAISAGNDFALRLLQRTTARSPGNVLLSPLSVSLALGMTMNGAADETLAEMQRTLGWGTANRADINVAYRDLMTLLPTLDPNVTVRIANASGCGSPWCQTPDSPATRGSSSTHRSPASRRQGRCSTR